MNIYLYRGIVNPIYIHNNILWIWGVHREKKVQLCLNKYLDTHGISRYALAKATGIGFPIIDRYYKNQVVRYDSDVLSRIVTALDCKLSDILTIENSK